MALPININDLLNGHAVESERVEFKEGWNPEEIIQAICAFANDFHNWGGGYLVLGVKTENGKPVMPPLGIQPEQADAWQRKLLELCHKIEPVYHPISEVANIGGKLVLVIWVSGGEMRPYKAPVSLVKGHREMAYYIRLHASTVKAKGDIEQELISLANRIPFDDRQNGTAQVTDLQPNLIQSFLAEVKSDLQSDVERLSLKELGQRMQIIRGPAEAPRPLNVGLLFFTPDPTRWFPQTQIDVVQLPQGGGGDQIIEKIFKGPINVMLRDALAYLRNNLITEYVTKHADRAEATRYFNIPYRALEEALVNAAYHRSYEEREPIEVQITPEEVTIMSFPGPDRSIKMEDLRVGRAVLRRYRNRRIGEFLKELELSEGRGTGIKKILRAMDANGSPKPMFNTDDQRTAFMVHLPLRPAPAAVLTSTTMQDEIRLDADLAPSRHQVAVLRMCLTDNSLLDLMKVAGRTDRTKFRHQVLHPLIAEGFIEPTIPDKPTSRLQKYRLTDKGRAWLKSITTTKPAQP